MKEEETNKGLWDELASIHRESQFYDIDSFLKGRNRLREFEINELGNVKGKKIIHLMCHIGLDSLSLVRMGAEVTAIDFSGEAIKTGRELSEKTGLTASLYKAIYHLFLTMLMKSLILSTLQLASLPGYVT
ncbi:MAG: methyltransferase domain-containing protein [Thermoplasmataceae archaeon]